MLEDRLYGTLERWFAFLETQHCDLTAKSRFIYGKYLIALGKTREGNLQITQAEKEFFETGHLQDYKKVLLFVAATKRREGDLLSANQYLARANADQETSWN